MMEKKKPHFGEIMFTCSQ